MGDYFSFEEVLNELSISEQELKRMVSEGELRAFREENEMKFKIDDVSHMKRDRITEPTIILPSSTDSGSNSTETVIDFGDDTGQTTASTDSVIDLGPDISDIGGISLDTDFDLSEDTQTLKIEPEQSSDIHLEPDNETVMETGNDETSSIVIEPIDLSDSIGGDTTGLTAELISEDIMASAPSAPDAIEPKGKKKKKKKDVFIIPPEVEAELEKRKPHPAWAFLMLSLLLITLCTTVYYYDYVRSEIDDVHPMQMTSDSYKMIIESNWADKNMAKFIEDPILNGEDEVFKIRFDDLPNADKVKDFYLGKDSLGPTFHLSNTPPDVLTKKLEDEAAAAYAAEQKQAAEEAAAAAGEEVTEEEEEETTEDETEE